MRLNNTTGAQDRTIARAEALVEEIPLMQELLDIMKDLDERFERALAESRDKDL